MGEFIHRGFCAPEPSLALPACTLKALALAVLSAPAEAEAESVGFGV